MLRVNTDFYTSIQTLNQNFYTYLEVVYIHTDTYLIRIHNQYTYILVHILYGTKLIQTETEPLRNKRVITEYFYLKGAISILIYLPKQ